MSRAAQDLIELARVCEVLEPGSFVIGGAKTIVDGTGAALELALSERLYHHHYCRPSAAAAQISFVARQELLAAYSRANRGRGTMDSGWRFVRVEADGSAVVEKHGVLFWAPAETVSMRDNAMRVPALGEEVLVLVPGEVTELVQGFYLFTGEATDATPPGPLARFYFHITEAGAIAFVEHVSATLNGAKIPFHAKILSEPSAFVRADAAVLYMRRSILGRGLPHLRAIYTSLRGFLRESVPMFTLRLAAGLGAADDPGEQSSFGQHRCAIAARGLIASYVGRPPTERERLASITQAYIEAGLSPTRTYLRSANAEPYPRFATRKWLDERSA